MWNDGCFHVLFIIDIYNIVLQEIVDPKTYQFVKFSSRASLKNGVDKKFLFGNVHSVVELVLTSTAQLYNDVVVLSVVAVHRQKKKVGRIC